MDYTNEINKLTKELIRQKQLNRIISKENEELKSINYGLLQEVNRRKNWYKNTIFYRGLRKIYRVTIKRWTKNGK